MSFRTISVFVPTRGRLPQLEALLASFAATVSDDAADLVFRVDDDDRASQERLRQTPYTVIVGPRLAGYRSLPRFFEDCRQASRGDLIMLGNDDMVFVTPDWPQKLLAHANQYPDGLFDFGVNTHNAKVFPWACVSRKAVDIMGHVMDPRLYWGDVYLRDVFAHFGRAIRINDVQIDHVWMGFTPDQTFVEANQNEGRNWDAAYWALHAECVMEAAGKLEAACLLAK